MQDKTHDLVDPKHGKSYPVTLKNVRDGRGGPYGDLVELDLESSQAIPDGAYQLRPMLVGMNDLFNVTRNSGAANERPTYKALCIDG